MAFLAAISAGDPIIPAFSAIPTRGYAPLTVNFTDLSSGSPTTWAWYFGDENYTGAEWKEQAASTPWGPRFGHAMVAMPDGNIVLMGGGGGYQSDVWMSSDGGMTWTLQNGTPGWPGREFHSAVVLPDGSIVITGGFNGAYLNDVWLSTDRGVTWRLQLAHAPWTPRAKHTAVTLSDGSIVLMGGFDGTTPRNDVWRSTDKGASWTLQNSNASWNARFGHASVVLPDGRIAVVGGRTSSNFFRDLWFSSDLGASWTKSPLGNLVSFTPRGYHSAAALPDGNIIIACGENWGSPVNDMVRLTNKTGNWSVERYEITPAISRYYHAGVILPDGGLVLTGGVNASAVKRDVQYFGSATLLQDPVHTYRKEGTYSVTLQASGTEAYNRTTRQDSITVFPPLSSPTVTGITPATGENTRVSLLVTISGTNFDTINPPSVRLSRAGYPDIWGENVSTPSPSQLTCTLSLDGYAAGPRDIIVTNPDGKSGVLSAGFSITQSPPVADFSARPASGTAPLQVEFTDTSTGFPTSWKWDFGDGTSSTERNPIHTYTLPGTYTVTLIVQNTGGSDTVIRPDSITVTSVRPPVIIAFSPASMARGKTVKVAIIGNYFQKGASARLTQGTKTIPVTITAITPPSKIAGIVTVPSSAKGKWALTVRNPDGGECSRANAIIVT
jgi:PKD repeat protein